MIQLKMEKANLADVPAVAAPPGYILRTFQSGDEAALGRIYEAGELGPTTIEAVRERMMNDPCFAPCRLFVAEHAGEPVATAAGWIQANDPGVGYLHMVGVLPEHRGKGLGALVVTSAIAFTRAEGFSIQRLDTDDHRIAALRLYASLGYYPVYVDDTHPARWEAIARAIRRPDLIARARQAVTSIADAIRPPASAPPSQDSDRKDSARRD